jgi:BirA family transcriptional regulator, biotin operon repressor / biotin---[acetyl-CoA-carboxylase] ligase
MERRESPIVHCLECTASTQRIAREYIELGAARAGHVIVAGQQTAGHGRQGREWLSPVGGFYATFIVPQDRLIAVRAGLAVARAVAELSVPVALKWPNDLLVEGRKLGGIGIEAVRQLDLVGVGLNLVTSPLPDSVSLLVLGVRVEPSALLHAIYSGLVTLRTEEEVLSLYRACLSTLGQTVRIDRGANAGEIVGRAVDVDSLGCLIVDTDTGRIAVAAGDCIHFSTS